MATAGQRLFYYNLGFARQRAVRRILQLSGYSLHLGLPARGDAVVVWGNRPSARRGLAVAARRGVAVVRVEDAFLRSIHPGRDAPLGLIIDPIGVHFDGTRPSVLEQILARDPLDDHNLLARAHAGMARLRALDLSKYNAHATPPPPPGYVLVIDQTLGDAAAPDPGLFRAMLSAAMEDHPGARILIKSHPETEAGRKRGHFSAGAFMPAGVSPRDALEGAIAVYTVSSQMGFEAILAGHRPHVFGQPFYAGWGLTVDANPPARRGRRLSRAQLFAAAMILAPRWYDPFLDRLCSFEQAVDILEARVSAYRMDRAGHVALGMRMWKRARLNAMFGGVKPLVFGGPDDAVRMGRGVIVWAGKEPPDLPADLPCLRIEDGFIRSRGLGARLVPPLSLVADDLGIYYDPSRPSRLEHLIAQPLDDIARQRTQVLLDRLRGANLSKYNLAGATPDLPKAGNRILVPGQVEDDASIRLGAGGIRTNLDLLRAARAAHPEGFIIYKPHPDVEAGLRPGAVSAAGLADMVAVQADPIGLILQCDLVFTMTSLLGFEALLRGRPVTCTGAPFYAGWGLTQDLGVVPDRRTRVDLLQLVHAALIAYPRYYDPVTRQICPPEVVIHRLIHGQIGAGHPMLGLLAKLQGRFAGLSHLWR